MGVSKENSLIFCTPFPFWLDLYSIDYRWLLIQVKKFSIFSRLDNCDYSVIKIYCIPKILVLRNEIVTYCSSNVFIKKYNRHDHI